MHTHRLLAALAFSLAGGLAQAADVTSPYVVRAPAVQESVCARPSVLGRIKHRFAYAERTNWHRGFVIETIDNPRPSGHPFAEPGLVQRDYCVADSVMTNGSMHPVYYAIEHGLGFVGIGTYVDFCVLGLDPWHVHDEACRAVR